MENLRLKIGVMDRRRAERDKDKIGIDSGQPHAPDKIIERQLQLDISDTPTFNMFWALSLNWAGTLHTQLCAL